MSSKKVPGGCWSPHRDPVASTRVQPTNASVPALATKAPRHWRRATGGVALHDFVAWPGLDAHASSYHLGMTILAMTTLSDDKKKNRLYYVVANSPKCAGRRAGDDAMPSPAPFRMK